MSARYANQLILLLLIPMSVCSVCLTDVFYATLLMFVLLALRTISSKLQVFAQPAPTPAKPATPQIPQSASHACIHSPRHRAMATAFPAKQSTA